MTAKLQDKHMMIMIKSVVAKEADLVIASQIWGGAAYGTGLYEGSFCVLTNFHKSCPSIDLVYAWYQNFKMTHEVMSQNKIN